MECYLFFTLSCHHPSYDYYWRRRASHTHLRACTRIVTEAVAVEAWDRTGRGGGTGGVRQAVWCCPPSTLVPSFPSPNLCRYSSGRRSSLLAHSQVPCLQGFGGISATLICLYLLLRDKSVRSIKVSIFFLKNSGWVICVSAPLPHCKATHALGLFSGVDGLM